MAKNYEEMNSKELRTACKENGISYSYTKDGEKHTMTKAEMVNALYDKADADEVKQLQNVSVEAEVQADAEIETPAEAEAQNVTINEDSPLDVLLAAREEIDKLISLKKQRRSRKDPRNEEYDENFSMYGGVNPFSFIHTKNKERYIEEAEVGTLIAFLDSNGKPRTAALVNRSSKRRLLKLQTEFKWEFEVPYDSVLWVRNGDRWAYGIYRILKGYNPNGKCGADTYGETSEQE